MMEEKKTVLECLEVHLMNTARRLLEKIGLDVLLREDFPTPRNEVFGIRSMMVVQGPTG